LAQAVMADWHFVVCCRTAEFEMAVAESGLLSEVPVVEMEPVTPSTLASYLSASEDDKTSRWAPVLAELRADHDGPLALALSVPLMAYLARVRFRSAAANPSELLAFSTREAVETFLLQGYLTAMYEAEPPVRYIATDAGRWLGFVARWLDNRQSEEIAWWHLPDAVRGWRWVAAAVMGVAAGISAGWAVGIGVGVVTSTAIGLTAGAAAAGLAGLTLAAGSISAGDIPMAPARLRPTLRRLIRPSEETRRHASRCGTAASVIVGVGLGIAVGYGHPLSTAVSYAVLAGAADLRRRGRARDGHWRGRRVSARPRHRDSSR
jgi:hypothetical protein